MAAGGTAVTSINRPATDYTARVITQRSGMAIRFAASEGSIWFSYCLHRSPVQITTGDKEEVPRSGLQRDNNQVATSPKQRDDESAYSFTTRISGDRCGCNCFGSSGSTAAEASEPDRTAMVRTLLPALMEIPPPFTKCINVWMNSKN